MAPHGDIPPMEHLRKSSNQISDFLVLCEQGHGDEHEQGNYFDGSHD